jgi:FAD/FMN-containing dehydrogenase
MPIDVTAPPAVRDHPTDAAPLPRRWFDGTVLLPGDDGYDDARRGWNRTIDSRPAAIALAATPADVVSAVLAARDHGLPLAIQSTGHGTVAAADGALLVKTNRLARLEIDAASRIARVGPGIVWDQVNHAAAAFGLGSLAGRCSSVGVTGYTLGGGTGWLSRRFGYAADNVIHADVVTADGRQVRASADENADLFWALRGGGGNFGIVTELAFRLFPAPAIWGGQSFYPADRAAAVFAAYRDWARDEPDEMNSAVLVMRLPPAPVIPEPLRGRQVLAVRAFHLGDEQSGRRALAPLLDVAGPPLWDGFDTRPFPAASAAAAGPDTPPIALRQDVEFFHHLPDDALAAAVTAGAVPSSPLAFVELRHWGGAISRPSIGAGPAGARNVPFSVMAVAPYLTPDRERVDARLDRLAGRLAPHATGEAFLNLLTDPTRTRDAFSPTDLRRLAEAKACWDPDNVFRLHHNIPPAKAAAPTLDQPRSPR